MKDLTANVLFISGQKSTGLGEKLFFSEAPVRSFSLDCVDQQQKEEE